MNRAAGTWQWDDVRFFLEVARAWALLAALCALRPSFPHSSASSLAAGHGVTYSRLFRTLVLVLLLLFGMMFAAKP